jgi:hypothetical protein
MWTSSRYFLSQQGYIVASHQFPVYGAAHPDPDFHRPCPGLPCDLPCGGHLEKISHEYNIASLLALVFGEFQFSMYFIGWTAGAWLFLRISGFGHWIVFILLVGIGAKMIYEGSKDGER